MTNSLLKGIEMTRQEIDWSIFPEDVDDATFSWTREPGKRGRHSSQEIAERDAADARRAAYPELIKLPDVVAVQQEQISALLAEVRRLRDSNSYQVNENRRLTQVLVDADARADLVTRVVADLAYLLDVELYLEPCEQGPSTTFRTVLGTFRMRFCASGPELWVKPANEDRCELIVPLCLEGIPASSVLQLSGHLGLPHGGRIPWHAADKLVRRGSQKETAAPVPTGSSGN